MSLLVMGTGEDASGPLRAAARPSVGYDRFYRTMVFGHIITSPRGNLSIQKSLDLANLFLENAEKAQDRDIALVLCHETEAALSHAKKASKHADGQTVRQGIGIAYIGLGRVLERQELIREAQEIYKKAEKMGERLTFCGAPPPFAAIE
ncbi:hypothetical protein B0O80DRAFT_424109 [Mortierella sp. GBAus27b]|nr:hypothetical protein B0O80DRAFT_424109 [Mortierella sp. GBAus27b]